MEEIKLTPHQRVAVQAATRWARDPGGALEMTLGGYAGTGKTTVLRFFRRYLSAAGIRIGVAAPTAKAVMELRRRGIPAATVHALLYNFVGTELDDDGNVELLFMLGTKANTELRVKLLVVDEASMVSKRMARDLRTKAEELGFRILWVGDHAQLKPIGEDPGIMLDPEIKLEQILRQQEGNPILQLAHEVREREPVDARLAQDGVLEFYTADTIDDIVEVAHDADAQVVICSTNATRVGVNSRWRIPFGSGPTLGDRVVCRGNRWDRDIVNGSQFEVTGVGRMHVLEGKGRSGKVNVKVVRLWLTDEDGRKWEDVPAALDGFNCEKHAGLDLPKEVVPLDFLPAITCHTAQGAEYERVLVVDRTDRRPDVHRWRYTAFTRASRYLAVCRLGSGF